VVGGRGISGVRDCEGLEQDEGGTGREIGRVRGEQPVIPQYFSKQRYIDHLKVLLCKCTGPASVYTTVEDLRGRTLVDVPMVMYGPS